MPPPPGQLCPSLGQAPARHRDTAGDIHRLGAPEVVRGSPPRPAPPANSHPPTGESARAATRGESAPGPPRAAHHPPTPRGATGARAVGRPAGIPAHREGCDTPGPPTAGAARGGATASTGPWPSPYIACPPPAQPPAPVITHAHRAHPSGAAPSRTRRARFAFIHTLRPLLGGYYGGGPCTAFFPYVRGHPSGSRPPTGQFCPPTGENPEGQHGATLAHGAPGHVWPANWAMSPANWRIPPGASAGGPCLTLDGPGHVLPANWRIPRGQLGGPMPKLGAGAQRSGAPIGVTPANWSILPANWREPRRPARGHTRPRGPRPCLARQLANPPGASAGGPCLTLDDPGHVLPANWRIRAAGPVGRRARSPPGTRRCRTHDGEQQGYLTAYTTRLVTSVVCRGSIPARGDIAIRQPAPEGFSPGAVASLLRCVARRPIRIQLRRAGRNRRVPARILT
ncbi:hypothetical protein N7469_009444 [Penicillium citrinum]|uniref:Uncharacterized protein n=1 Tax=Penicillium citrinum TaxID=5077 RepID=A0A9W9TI02_PENCI|nr:hypothetical protein N7469_009444 [Penicillium citrinum]